MENTMNTETETLSLPSIKALVLAAAAPATRFTVDRAVTPVNDIYGSARTDRIHVRFNGSIWGDVRATTNAVRDALRSAGLKMTAVKSGAKSYGISGNTYWAAFQVGASV